MLNNPVQASLLNVEQPANTSRRNSNIPLGKSRADLIVSDSSMNISGYGLDYIETEECGSESFFDDQEIG